MSLWTPAKISCAFWFDAADASTITRVSGTERITRWDSKCGNGRYADYWSGYPDYVASGQNGQNVIQFTGADTDRFAINAANGSRSVFRNIGQATIFTVANKLATYGSTIFHASAGGTVANPRIAVSHYLDTKPYAWGRRLDGDTTQAKFTAGARTGYLLGTYVYDWANALLHVGLDGVLETRNPFQTAGNTSDTDSTGMYIGFPGTGQTYQGYIAEIVVVIACDEATRYLVEGYLAHKWGIADYLPVSHPYRVTPPADVRSVVRAQLDQPWGIKIGVDLHQPWGDAPLLRAAIHQPWGDAPVLRAELSQRWESTLTMRSVLDQRWHVFGVLRAELEQRWAITADLVRGVLEQGWDLRDRDLLRAELLQRWAIEADGSVLRYQVAVTVNGAAVGISHLNIEAGLDQDVLSCELHLGSEADHLRCRIGSVVAITITSAEGAEAFAFVVTAPRITEEHGNAQFIVEAMSPAVLLGEPYAAPIEGELSGLVTIIAATLAGTLPLSWQTVDWEIPPSTWIAAGETPLSLLKTPAGAVGAVVQSLPDGSLVVVPEYSVAVNQWAAAAPDLSLVENLDCWSTGSTPELKSGYNRFLIGDQLSTANTLRLDEESISATVKIVRGYQTPWDGIFDLAHTGGAWVVIEPLGVEERQETETIEIVAGAGRVQYPIYSRDVIEWGQINLGSVTVSEDGSVQAAVAGESLLTITYTTRCKRWQVRNPRNEQLQLVVPA